MVNQLFENGNLDKLADCPRAQDMLYETANNIPRSVASHHEEEFVFVISDIWQTHFHICLQLDESYAFDDVQQDGRVD